MVLGKRVFPIWVLVTFKGPMLNFENVQTIGTRKQHNSQLQWIFSLKLPASNIFFVWNAFVFFFHALIILLLFSQKSGGVSCGQWKSMMPLGQPYPGHSWDEIFASELGFFGDRVWQRVRFWSPSWDSSERYLRCIYGPSKGWTVWLEDDGLINQKFEQHVFFFLAEIQNKACFQSFCPASFSLRWNW